MGYGPPAGRNAGGGEIGKHMQGKRDIGGFCFNLFCCRELRGLPSAERPRPDERYIVLHVKTHGKNKREEPHVKRPQGLLYVVWRESMGHLTGGIIGPWTSHSRAALSYSVLYED